MKRLGKGGIPAALMVKSGKNAFRQTGGEAAEAVHERRILSGSDRSGRSSRAISAAGRKLPGVYRQRLPFLNERDAGRWNRRMPLVPD